jgi:hypothetical protein
MTTWLHDIGFRGGHVTRAFDEWRLEHGYLLAYERVGIQFTSEGYHRLWEELGSQPSDGEGPELPDLFDEAVGNLALWQFEQIHLAAALRDAVTVFEMYLEAALVEVLETQLGQGLDLPEKSPYWDDLKAAWKSLSGVNLERRGVHAVRGRRNWLTHQRGQFRTSAQRAQHDTHEFGWPDPALRLTRASVAKDMDTLAEAAAAVDTEAHRLSWGRESAPAGEAQHALDALLRASAGSGGSTGSRRATRKGSTGIREP